ncbi:MAG: hypothetical protein ABFR32_10835 [Bacteroidota bacterium]
MKKIIINTLIFLLFSQVITAQCAMCRAVVEQGGDEVAEGVNNGIVYLMFFPYIIIGAAAFFLYRNWKKNNG